MKPKWLTLVVACAFLTVDVGFLGSSFAWAAEDEAAVWQAQAVDYARIMSRVTWTPVADGMPNRRGGYFEKGRQYTGVPYSSVKTQGRCIGFDIYLKTFLAAVENPRSVLYTENLSGSVSNAATYYGKVCSTFTSYALQCALPYRSSHHDAQFRQGVELVEPQSAQAAKPGDIIYTPPATVDGGSHVELVTDVTHSGDRVTAVRVEDSWPPTARDLLRSAADFDSHIASRNRKLYRITDLDAWREQNRAELFLFPDYEDDSVTPAINRVLLLDRGDWVPYFRDQVVKFNVLDRDSQGAQLLVIRRGDEVVEQISLPGTGVVERRFSLCGSYTAHCVLRDGSQSQACEFSVCALDFSLPAENPARDESWEIEFSADNLNVIAVHLAFPKPPYHRHHVWLGENERQRGQVAIPAGLVRDTGPVQVHVIGENRYGRLTRQKEIHIRP